MRFSALQRLGLWIVAVASLVTAILLLMWAGLPERSDFSGFVIEGLGYVAPEIGEIAPPIEAELLSGDEISLDNLRGKTLIINFWATWCIPCRKEMPYLQEVFEKHGDQLTVLAINMNEDADRVRPFIQEFGYTYPILLDPSDDLAAEHNVRGLPVSFIVGPEGDIVYRRIGEILPEEFDVWLAENLSS